ncbi:hypothetical protein K439DRAFT_322919 [Ramaria rubella]|nr:hypothetical protein K439DRAFT_322919 [Ramaria rubella]
MPAPGLYVVAVVVGVAAGFAFKEFVYDPHLAPKIEEWTGAYAAYRREKRRRRTNPHSHSHSDDDEDVRDSEAKSSSGVELEGLVEREMHTFLRQRKTVSSDRNALEMMEKPNPSIPFVPLSPTPPLSPTSFTDRGDAALPIGRLPMPQSENPFASRASVSSTGSRPAVAPRTPASNPFISSPAPSENPSIITAPVASTTSPTSEFASPVPRAWPTSEYDFALGGTSSSSRGTSRGTTPFTSAGVSRIGSPFTDARSETSFADVGSRSSFSDASSLDQHSHYLEVSFFHPTTHPETFLDGRSESSFSISSASSVDTGSDASVDSLGPEVDLHRELLSPTEPALGVLSDDEWDRVSDPGR